MTDVRIYYAFFLEEVLGKRFQSQNLTLVYLDERVKGKDRDAATAYIHEQDPSITIASCNGELGLQKAIKGKNVTRVRSLPSRDRGLLPWLAGVRERMALRKVARLEEQWPTGREKNLVVLLRYFKHHRPYVRDAAVIAIGEYLTVMGRQANRGAIFSQAVTTLLAALSSETNGFVLVSIGSALGNTDSLITPDDLLAALQGRDSNDIEKVAHGIRLLRRTEYRAQLLEALEQPVELPISAADRCGAR